MVKIVEKANKTGLSVINSKLKMRIFSIYLDKILEEGETLETKVEKQSSCITVRLKLLASYNPYLYYFNEGFRLRDICLVK